MFSFRFCQNLSGILVILFIASYSELLADVKMPAIFSDNMVLQREIPLNVWGWTAPGEKVTVSFAGQTVSADADKDGNWAVKLKPVAINKTPQSLTISGKNEIVFKNILVGDVWICSGQSNMEMCVKNCLNAKKEIEHSANSLIRHVAIKHTYSLYPQDNILVSSIWEEASSSTTPDFTAAGYFFACEIVKETGVPIGLINASWGGTPIEPWISAKGFRMIPTLKGISSEVDLWIPTTPTGKKNFLNYLEALKIWSVEAETAVEDGKIPTLPPAMPGIINNMKKPTMIFNSMINPITKYGIKGVIWYQGESNGREGESYMHKMNALISDWRSLWGEGNFPFYFVQIANYRKPNPDNAGGADLWTKCREAQLKTLAIVPNTGMAVSIDIGEAGDIHPKNKQDIGKRLGAWALAKDYGKNNIMSGPLYKKFEIEGNKIRIWFDHIGNGLAVGEKNGLESFKETPGGNKLKSFAIAGVDKKWYWADAVIEGDTVVVSCEKVLSPVAVRYAFSMNPAQGVNFYNKEGFPASPFRTDNWE